LRAHLARPARATLETLGLVAALVFFVVVLPALFDGGDPSTPAARAALRAAAARREQSRLGVRSWLLNLRSARPPPPAAAPA
jgi:hypothetical protein